MGQQSAVDTLLKIPAFVSESMSDCFEAMALAFINGEDMAPILEAACRAKAAQEIEDTVSLIDRRDPDFKPAHERVVDSWKAYQRKHGPHPAEALSAAFDAQEARQELAA